MSNLNKTLGLDQIGLNRVSKIHRNLNVDNLINEITTAAPSNSKTIETVVEVGSP